MNQTAQGFVQAQMRVWGSQELHDSRNPAVAQVIRKRLKALLQQNLGEGRLLDVGGYRGLQVEGLRAYVHDLSLPALRDATSRIDGVTCGDIHQLPFASNSLDGVLISHVLEHSHQPELLLEEIARILKPQGFLAVVVPNASGLGQILKLIRRGDVKPSGNPPWEPPEHLHHFTRANTIKFLSDNHWQIIHFEGDILDFPLRDKLRSFRLARWLGQNLGRWSESLIFICRYQK